MPNIRAIVASCLGAAALGGCPSTPVAPPKWTESTLIMQVQGIELQGDKLSKASWEGTGFWIDQDLLATNAHVATRALQIVGVDDDGNKYHFDTVVAIDRDADIAILHADRKGDKPGVEFIDKPQNPKDLRGRETMMVGNSGGLGLGFFDGRVTNVLGDPGTELILHTTSVVGGSSGSAVYDKLTHKVMGIHHSGVASLDAKIASPSWRIQKTVAEARTRHGIALEELFTLPHIAEYAHIWGQRDFCVKPGEAYKVSFDAPRATDVLGFVKPTDDTAVLNAGLVMGGQDIVWKGAFQGTVYLPFSLAASGPYNLVVVAPDDAPGPICGVMGAGEIAWEQGIN